MAGLRRILLVEDNDEIVDIYSRIITTSDYELRTAMTIQSMLEIVLEYHPDVILLDIMLPGGQTGIDGLKILRQEDKYNTKTTKIVLLTNLGENEELRKIWQEYADGYVIKAEIDPHELPDIIESLFADSQSNN